MLVVSLLVVVLIKWGVSSFANQFYVIHKPYLSNEDSFIDKVRWHADFYFNTSPLGCKPKVEDLTEGADEFFDSLLKYYSWLMGTMLWFVPNFMKWIGFS